MGGSLFRLRDKVPVAPAWGLGHIPGYPQIPRGREGATAPRRRRNRPPETLRQKGRVGEGPLESPAVRPAPTE